MTFATICSGVDAPALAWRLLGWRQAWSAEIEKFPSAVLAHRHPGVPNHGDFTRISSSEPIDVLCGGTPCQSFSIAGRRAGLDDPRGVLAFEFLRLAQRLRPRWILWENVFGFLSDDGGRSATAWLRAVAECGYGGCYRVLDGQFAGVAQRRERVWFVGYLGDWRPAAAVLFEPESLQWNPAPSRETREIVTALTSNGVGTCGADDNQAQGGHLIPIQEINKRTGSGGEGRNGCGIGSRGDPMFSLLSGAQHGIAFDGNNSGALDVATARRITPREAERLMGMPDDYTLIPTYRKLQREKGEEAERLYEYYCRTEWGREAVLWKNGRVYATPDGPRYKAIGNSMIVPELAWIGRRIQMVDECRKP